MKRAIKCCVVFAVLALVVSGSAQNPVENDTYDYAGSKLTPLERRGRDTWYLWAAGDQRLWREIAIITNGATDLLRYVDSRRNGSRFRDLGVITEPGCTKATAPDEYGLWFDQCPSEGVSDIPGEPTGVMGLRKFPNPKFDKTKWSLQKYLENPKNVEPPYLIGMTCGYCHNAFNPLNPPEDPEHPHWKNISPALGNQYLEEGKLFLLNLKPDDFRWHVANRQPAGTSDTSRVATDHIYNPNVINSIFNLEDRPLHAEKQSDGTTKMVNHILKDGADSIGIPGASLRVYVNIGMCSEYWLTLHDAVEGIGDQKPFLIDKARRDCADYRATEERMPAAEAFLKTLKPMHLQDAPGGEKYLTTDQDVLKRGKTVFAEQCASCHSSKRPPAEIASDKAATLDWYRKSVLADDFLDHNFLSDDERHPVTEIGTNFGRAVASNATKGHIWDNYSSETYKSLPSVGKIKNLYNPVTPTQPISFDMPGGGRGYYRTPTLISMWATAPYFHNNSLGIFIKDPSVDGRMVVFEDAVEKLLWPEKRLGVQSILVTTQNSKVRGRDGSELDVPMGTPIKLVANLDPNTLPFRGEGSNWITQMFGRILNGKLLWESLVPRNLAPDFIEDRGHTFGSQLSDEDKRALIEFLKTL